MSGTYLEQLKKVKVFVFDIDGVITDGNIYVDDNGLFTRSTSVKDGYAFAKAKKAGFPVVVISGGSAEGVKIRLNRLGIDDVFLYSDNKIDILRVWLSNHDYTLEDCLMMGDDEPDLRIMEHVGFSCCPSDAVPLVRESVDYVSPKKGGHECVRDVIETRLRLTNQW
jgi:3-deoxy-D-manno-octulosonate 8-phosphate phosphatase (KDO 8-P phosphatase)